MPCASDEICLRWVRRRCDNGSVIVAPHDIDQFVRQCTSAEAAASVKLRFKPGDRVLCNLGQAERKKGVVVRCHVKPPLHPDAKGTGGASKTKPVAVPYEIKLDSGETLFAPVDRENIISAA